MTVDVPPWALDVGEPQPGDYLETAFGRLLVSAERAHATRPGLVDTPARAARAWRELTAGYAIDVASLFTTFESDGFDELVLVSPIPFYSLCEHHLLPFHGAAAIAYVPNGRILGLSKFARLVDAFARRLQVQERMTVQIADAIVEHLDPQGVMVVAEAEHLCMAMRGVRAAGAITTTSAVRGVFLDKPEARAEALALIDRR